MPLAGLGPEALERRLAGRVEALDRLAGDVAVLGVHPRGRGPRQNAGGEEESGGRPGAAHRQNPTTSPRRGPTYVYARGHRLVVVLVLPERDSVDVRPADDAEVLRRVPPEREPGLEDAPGDVGRAEADRPGVEVERPVLRDRSGDSEADQRRRKSHAEVVEDGALRDRSVGIRDLGLAVEARLEVLVRDREARPDLDVVRPEDVVVPADVRVVVVELAVDRDARLVRVAVPDDVPLDRARARAVQGRVAEVDVVPLRDAPGAVTPEVPLGRGNAEQLFQVERGPDADEPAPA